MKKWSEFWGYTPAPIDLDAGLTRRGGAVSMYKNLPGLYVDDLGNEVKDEEAAAVGFNLEADRRRAQKMRELMDVQSEVIRKHEQIEADAPPPPEPKSAEVVVEDARVDIVSRNSGGEPRETRDFRMDHMGGPRWRVIKKSDKSVVAFEINKEEATQFMFDSQRETDSLMAR